MELKRACSIPPATLKYTSRTVVLGSIEFMLELDVDWIQPWIGLGWIGLDWIGSKF